MIRPATTHDSVAIAEICNSYIRDTTITFEEQEVSNTEISKRIQEVNDSGLPWLVAIEAEKIIGYAYATKWKGRCAYRYSVETSIYLDLSQKSKGWGTRLYTELINALEPLNLHVVIGGIALPNPQSVALHEKFGFKKVAHFQEVGFKFGQWIDVGYWQKTIARDM